MDGRVFQTSSSAYGKGTNVEVYKDSKYNIHENKDLRALERRLPKGWKKPKWTPRTYAFMQLLTHTTLLPRWGRRSEKADSVHYCYLLHTLTITSLHLLNKILFIRL